MKRWLWLVSLAVFLAPAFALKPEWRQVDVNADGKAEQVAVTNLADIAFNTQGQIVGWYVKTTRAQDFKGNYSRAANLVKTGVVLPGTLSDFKPDKSEFIRSDSTDPNADFIARFTQGATVLTYSIHPRFLTIDVNVKTPTARTLTWTGIDNSSSPTTKWLASGGSQPASTGSGSATYVSWQTQPKAGFAMVIRPTTPTNIKMNLVSGAGVAEVSVPAGGLNLKVYGGANELVRLHVERFYDLPGLFQPNIWGQISLGMLWVLEESHKIAGGSWVLAIVIVTILLRLLMWPLMHQQYKSMAEMQKIQPLMKKIQEKYKDNKEKQQEETMKLYQEHKINPLAGCLPLVLQMPILFLMYRIIVGYEFGQGFLWVPDLALPDPIYILPVLYILVLLASTWLSSAGNRDSLRQGILMNLVFAFLLFSFPAGVTLYWVLSTLISVGQQWLINRSLGIKMAPAKS
ncbi:MAG: membrane protein insertase YidC [Thermaceae bacterium]|nr:membrane protein insertase YidC [Thermaceae bacterium]